MVGYEIEADTEEIESDVLEKMIEEAKESAEEKEEPIQPQEEEKPLVSLQVFLNVCGLKWDQTAGFKHYATKQKMRKMTIPNWREEFHKFMGKPIKK